MGTPCRNIPAGWFDCLLVREGQVPNRQLSALHPAMAVWSYWRSLPDSGRAAAQRHRQTYPAAWEVSMYVRQVQHSCQFFRVRG